MTLAEKLRLKADESRTRLKFESISRALQELNLAANNGEFSISIFVDIRFVKDVKNALELEGLKVLMSGNKLYISWYNKIDNVNN